MRLEAVGIGHIIEYIENMNLEVPADLGSSKR
jgi:hypothetical protein